MSAKHTPGPWSAAAHIVYSGPHHRVATVQAVGAQAEADAALIASAPDLLAALEDALCTMLNVEVFYGKGEMLTQSMDKAEAVILKAKGGAA